MSPGENRRWTSLSRTRALSGGFCWSRDSSGQRYSDHWPYTSRSAISESIAVCGVLLFLLGAGYAALYVFVAMSAMSMLLGYPQRGELERYLSAVEGEE